MTGAPATCIGKLGETRIPRWRRKILRAVAAEPIEIQDVFIPECAGPKTEETHIQPSGQKRQEPNGKKSERPECQAVVSQGLTVREESTGQRCDQDNRADQHVHPDCRGGPANPPARERHSLAEPREQSLCSIRHELRRRRDALHCTHRRSPRCTSKELRFPRLRLETAKVRSDTRAPIAEDRI